MSNYSASFLPKKKRLYEVDFRVTAESPEKAKKIAEFLLTGSGFAVSDYKPPKVRNPMRGEIQ